MNGLWIPLTVAVIDWVAVAGRWRRLEYAAKPATLVALLGWLWLQGAWSGPIWVFADGLALSLLGDILLLPERHFLGGLAAFLLAHVAYMAVFNWSGLPRSGIAAVLAASIALAGAALARRVVVALAKAGRGKLSGPVVAYTAVLSGMAMSAAGTLVRPDWDAGAAGLVAVGAGLFMLSDAVLAWNAFVRPLGWGRLVTMMTYHLAQIALAAGIARQFIS